MSGPAAAPRQTWPFGASARSKMDGAGKEGARPVLTAGKAGKRERRRICSGEGGRGRRRRSKRAT
eukprot:5917351-Pyramimonas_sp.AAC.1